MWYWSPCANVIGRQVTSKGATHRANPQTDRLMALISEIDRLLCEKEKRPLQFDTTESSTMSAVSGEEKPDAFQPNRAPKAHEKHLGK